MKTIGCYLTGALAATMLLVGCGSAKYASTSDDLYNPDSRLAIAKREAARAELEKAEAEARRAKYEALLAQQEADKAEKNYRNGSSILSDDDYSYNSVYARKLYAFDSPTYILPATYYDYRYSYYDPFYNVVVVDPRYVSSLYGLWGPSYYYAWNRPWIGTSWSWGWGNAYWNWTLSWNWGWGWDPYWGWGGYYPPHHHYPGYHPPHHHDRGPSYSHRPNYRTFNNGYRNPAVNNIAQGSGTRNPAGSGYRPSTPSKSDYYNNRTGSSSKPSYNNNKNNSYNSSRGSGTSSSGNRTSTNNSTTYRRGGSSSPSSGGSYSSPSRGSYGGGSYGGGGGFGGGSSSGGGSGRTQGGR